MYTLHNLSLLYQMKLYLSYYSEQSITRVILNSSLSPSHNSNLIHQQILVKPQSSLISNFLYDLSASALAPLKSILIDFKLTVILLNYKQDDTHQWLPISFKIKAKHIS